MEILSDTFSSAINFYGIDWLATACGLLGVYLLGNKNKIGFALFMVASASWVTFGFLTHSIAVVIGSSIFFLMHLRGFIRWTRSADAQ
ncbi:MAG: PnuC protein [Acidobacteria bacterium]|nr:MAG: PnuC protein [Acidobacteriota bacterium]REJ98867.1 MAG: PnuC protein [Acidobacteriota bacterium]REK16413.1 MAG: PnuC protein [Acidobacteriota bacterium]REK44094.1 MAG: PnuC protein [Acidobacteriota bacterium]